MRFKIEKVSRKQPGCNKHQHVAMHRPVINWFHIQKFSESTDDPF